GDKEVLARKREAARFGESFCAVEKRVGNPPLGQVQATLCERDDVRKLVETINRRARETNEKVPSDDVLATTFERFWPDFQQDIERARAIGAAAVVPIRTAEQLLEEILVTVRGLQRERVEEIRAALIREQEYRKTLARDLLIQELSKSAAAQSQVHPPSIAQMGADSSNRLGSGMARHPELDMKQDGDENKS